MTKTKYTDAHGQTWRRGAVDWFFTDESGTEWVCHHEDMLRVMREEAKGE